LWSNVSQFAFPRGIHFNTIFRNPKEYKDEFQKSLNWLKNELASKSTQEIVNDRQIIITHHLPSFSLQHPRYKKTRSEFDTLFYSEILEEIDLSKVNYWFAGHTHECMTITYGSTKIIVNPYGYPREQNRRSTKISSEIHWL